MLLRRLRNRFTLAKIKVKRYVLVVSEIVSRNDRHETLDINRLALLENTSVSVKRPRPKAQFPDGAFWGAFWAGTFLPLTRGVVGGPAAADTQV
jgi:hypothetical protein